VAEAHRLYDLTPTGFWVVKMRLFFTHTGIFYVLKISPRIRPQTDATMGSTYWISESQGNRIQVSWLTSVM
jgi:hypothetical protein